MNFFDFLSSLPWQVTLIVIMALLIASVGIVFSIMKAISKIKQIKLEKGKVEVLTENGQPVQGQPVQGQPVQGQPVQQEQTSVKKQNEKIENILVNPRIFLVVLSYQMEKIISIIKIKNIEIIQARMEAAEDLIEIIIIDFKKNIAEKIKNDEKFSDNYSNIYHYVEMTISIFYSNMIDEIRDVVKENKIELKNESEYKNYVEERARENFKIAKRLFTQIYCQYTIDFPKIEFFIKIMDEMREGIENKSKSTYSSLRKKITDRMDTIERLKTEIINNIQLFIDKEDIESYSNFIKYIDII